MDSESNPEPKPPENYPGEKESQTLIETLSHDIRVRKDLLEKFKDQPKICPTCGAETDAILKKAKVYKAELPPLEHRLSNAKGIQDLYVAYGREHAKWQQWSQDREKRVNALAKDWEDYRVKAEDDPAADPEACQEVVDAGLTLDRAVSDMTIRIDQLNQEVSRWSTRRDENKVKLAKLKDELGKSPDQDAVARAKGDLVSVELVAREATHGEGELKAVTTNLVADEAMLQRLEEAESKAETDRLWAYHLAEIRKVMHHDRLPKVVAHNYLEILADDTNELLESFDADFRVSLGDGLNFEATFLRGRYAGAVSPCATTQ